MEMDLGAHGHLFHFVLESKTLYELLVSEAEDAEKDDDLVKGQEVQESLKNIWQVETRSCHYVSALSI